MLSVEYKIGHLIDIQEMLFEFTGNIKTMGDHIV